MNINPDTLAGALETACNRWPLCTALVFEGRKVTYVELGKAVMTLARAYRRLGIRQGDRVVCAVSIRPEQIVALGAAWTCGAVHVGVDYEFTVPELSSVIELTQASALLYEPGEKSSETSRALRELREVHPHLRIILVTDRWIPKDFLALSELIRPGVETENPEKLPLEGPSPQDPAMIFISSGTTGKPKAALGYHGNLSHRWRRLAEWLEFGPDDVHLAQLPLSHGFGMMMATAALLTGCRLVLLGKFSSEEALQLIETEGVTVLSGAPAHFKLIIDRLCRTGHEVHGIRLSVGTAAYFSPSLVHSIWDDLGVKKFMFMYGSSEGVGVATTDPEDILRGSVGRPAPGSVAIVGPHRKQLPLGERGEIAFSREVFPVQYWNESAAESPAGAAQEAAHSESGWYYSGDLGHIDEMGRLYVSGRLNRQIDRGGLKVDPVEVEGALLRCPGVFDAAVIGLPNPILGETVCACVVPQTEQAPGLQQLRTTLSSELAPYKLPEELCILDQIPRTAIGKVDLEKLHGEVVVSNRQRLKNW